MSLRVYFATVVFISTLRYAYGTVSVSISSEPEGDPTGVYQAATPVTLTCTHNGSSSATYSWTCSGEYNCFTQGLTQPSKKRGILRGGDTGIHNCTVNDGGMTGAASTNITVTGIGFSYKGIGGSSFHYVANNSAIFIPKSSTVTDAHVLADLECASGTTSSSLDQLLFLTPIQYKNTFTQVYEPGHWKLKSSGGIIFNLQSFSGGVFTCRMPDENGAVVDTSVGIYPNNYDINSLSVSLSYNQTGQTLILTCISSGLPPTIVTWSKDGVEMSSGDKYTISQRVIDVDSTVYENRLVMSGDSESDLQGLYQCAVQCNDDYGSLISNASATSGVADSADNTVTSTLSISSSSPVSSSLAIVYATSTTMSLITSTKSPGFVNTTLISNSSNSVFATGTFSSSMSISYTSIDSSIVSSMTAQTSSTPTPISMQMSITQIPIESQTPTVLKVGVLYAIIAVGAALLILLLLCVIFGCCCFFMRQRRNRKEKQKTSLEMQEFGMTPSEKAMAETLNNIPKNVTPESMKKAETIEYEDIELTASSLTDTTKHHQLADKTLSDKHFYEEIKDPNRHEYEDVDTDMVSKLQKESVLVVSSPSLQVSTVAIEKETVGIKQNDGVGLEKEVEKNTFEEGDLEVTAIDEDEEVEEQKQMVQDNEKETKSGEGEPDLQEDSPQTDCARSQVTLESHPHPPVVELNNKEAPPPLVVELEEEEAPPPPSSPPPPSTTNLDVTVPQLETKLHDKATDFVVPGEIPISEFVEQVKRLHNNNNDLFLREYSTFSSRLALPHDTGSTYYNTSKNRFKDIIAYDHSRVLLKEEPGVMGSDYINANYIHGWNKENMYIAAQGPTNKTMADFWRMVWENKLCTIVMLTRCVEGGKTKCQQYWPNNLKMTALYDSGIRVTLDNITSFAEYEYRKMTVKSTLEPAASPLEVTHFQYIIWPDHGVPLQSNSLMSFICRTRAAHPPDSDVPLLVHCSAGVGRSGTFITLDSMMLRMKDMTTLDVYGFVKGMRAQRTQMVQTDTQYIFIHDALKEMIEFGDSSIQSAQLSSLVLGFDQDKTQLNHQFKMLVECSPPVNEQLCYDGLLPANADKNRVRSIVPFNRNRLILWSPDRREQHYINASLMDSYSHRGGFIATQTPMPKTIKNFWQMMWDFQSIVAVTLSEEEEKLFVLEQGIEMEVGNITVVLESEAEEKGYVKRVYQISSHGTAKKHNKNNLNVTQFQLRDFPTMISGSSLALLDMINSILKIQMATGNRPITVMCPDGSGCSGVFMVVYSQLEKLKVEGMVDIFQCVRTMRTQRPGIVEDVQQYELCFRILLDYLESVETYSNFQPLSLV